MTSQSRRKSIHIGGFKHANPIPNACRIGDLVMSGVILGRDAAGQMPDSLEAQCANMFGHMKAIVEAAGGSTDDIIKMTVWLNDRTQAGAGQRRMAEDVSGRAFAPGAPFAADGYGRRGAGAVRLHRRH